MTSLCAPPEAGLRSPALGAGHVATSIRLLRSTAPTISLRSSRNSRNPRPRKTESGVCVPGRVGLLCDPLFSDRHAWRSEGIGVTDPFQAPAYIPHVSTIRSTARTPRHASWRGAFHCDVAVAAATSVLSQSVALVFRSAVLGRAATLSRSTATRARMAYSSQPRTPRGVRSSTAWRNWVAVARLPATPVLGVAVSSATSWGVAPHGPSVRHAWRTSSFPAFPARHVASPFCMRGVPRFPLTRHAAGRGAWVRHAWRTPFFQYATHSPAPAPAYFLIPPPGLVRRVPRPPDRVACRECPCPSSSRGAGCQESAAGVVLPGGLFISGVLGPVPRRRSGC